MLAIDRDDHDDEDDDEDDDDDDNDRPLYTLHAFTQVHHQTPPMRGCIHKCAHLHVYTTMSA